ncbi:MAG: hypothetical protein QHH75_10845 [Bacillota bacterium]|nr:hypothetical protein [Bacillota bacterium]
MEPERTPMTHLTHTDSPVRALNDHTLDEIKMFFVACDEDGIQKKSRCGNESINRIQAVILPVFSDEFSRRSGYVLVNGRFP